MNVLLLGGTRFLGPAVIAAITLRGWRLTVVHSGRRALGIGRADLREIQAPRAELANSIAPGCWDLVVDTQARQAECVRQARRTLGSRIGCYVFMSTANVYAGASRERLTEADASLRVAKHASGDRLRANALAKLEAEAEVQQAFGDAGLIFRLAYLVGPGDPIGRFYYWRMRAQGCGPVLRPEPSECPLQFVDVRDVAEFLCRCADHEARGIYNVAGPCAPFTFSNFLARVFCDSLAGLRPVDLSVLRIEGVETGSIPLWEPEVGCFGQARLNCERAMSAGLHLRNLEASLNATPPATLGSFLSLEREAALLAHV